MVMLKILLAGSVALWSMVATNAYCDVVDPQFEILSSITGPDGSWDYATVDAAMRRLYIGRSYGVMTVNLDTQSVESSVVAGSTVHGVAVAGESGLLVSTNGKSNTATIFEGKSGKIIAEIGTGKDPDAVVFEPRTGLIAVINHDGGGITLIDPKQLAAVGSIEIGGELEFGAADGKGFLYVNLADTHRVAVVDVVARKVVNVVPLVGCKNPTGIAYDAADAWVISVCFNGVAKIIDAATLQQIASIPTGKIPDAVIWDGSRRLAFVPSYADGTLTVIALDSSGKFRVTQTLKTQPGTRTGALDPSTGRVYLPTSRLVRSDRAGEYPKPVPGTFRILVVGTK
jgi:DNA-binding beta-propeller fold protein YncE